MKLSSLTSVTRALCARQHALERACGVEAAEPAARDDDVPGHQAAGTDAAGRQDALQERELVADGALEVLAGVDVEVPDRVVDDLADAARSSAICAAGPGRRRRVASQTHTSSGAVTFARLRDRAPGADEQHDARPDRVLPLRVLPTIDAKPGWASGAVITA